VLLVKVPGEIYTEFITGIQQEEGYQSSVVGLEATLQAGSSRVAQTALPLHFLQCM
jgi:hypothetical protein